MEHYQGHGTQLNNYLNKYWFGIKEVRPNFRNSQYLRQNFCRLYLNSEKSFMNLKAANQISEGVT